MNRRAPGFTIIEMLIALSIVSLVVAAASAFFIASVTQYKTQTKIIETNVEGILGMELLRQDLESMGFGLPWNNLVAYDDARSGVDPSYPADLDDSPNPPRAVVSIDCAAFTVNRSDYLVIKSTRVGTGDAAGKWTTLTQTDTKRTWTPLAENIANNDYVIVLRVGTTDANRRSLVTSGTFHTRYNNTGGFVPVEPYVANLVYGIGPGTTVPVRPFNRAEYYIANAASTPPVSVPQHCAPNTGVLVKAVVAQAAGGPTQALLPLVDCAADLQVVYGLDNNADGTVDSWTDDISVGMDSAQIRAQLAEIRLHILAQEGQLDKTYSHTMNPITVGSEGAGNPSFSITGYEHYRWKLYSIVVRPKNLAQ